MKVYVTIFLLRSSIVKKDRRVSTVACRLTVALVIIVSQLGYQRGMESKKRQGSYEHLIPCNKWSKILDSLPVIILLEGSTYLLVRSLWFLLSIVYCFWISGKRFNSTISIELKVKSEQTISWELKVCVLV